MSTTTTKPATPTTTKKEETVVEHVTRSGKNGFFACFGFTKKSGDLAKIKYKETLISNRQKAFGTEYFGLLNKGNATTDADLKACVEAAQSDIEVLKGEINELESKIASVDEETKRKIVAPPVATGDQGSSPPAATTAATTTTTTTAAPETATTTPPAELTPAATGTAKPPTESLDDKVASTEAV